MSSGFMYGSQFQLTLSLLVREFSNRDSDPIRESVVENPFRVELTVNGKPPIQRLRIKVANLIKRLERSKGEAPMRPAAKFQQVAFVTREDFIARDRAVHAYHF